MAHFHRRSRTGSMAWAASTGAVNPVFTCSHSTKPPSRPSVYSYIPSVLRLSPSFIIESCYGWGENIEHLKASDLAVLSASPIPSVCSVYRTHFSPPQYVSSPSSRRIQSSHIQANGGTTSTNMARSLIRTAWVNPGRERMTRICTAYTLMACSGRIHVCGSQLPASDQNVG